MHLTYSRLVLLVSVWLAACCVGCSTDTTRTPGEPDTGISGDGAAPEGDAGRVLDMDARAGLDAARDARIDPGSIRPDGAICVALGCDELNYECGQTVDNCGDPLNCNLAANATPCAAPTRCGGDPDLGSHRCGCKPRTDACAAQAAQCGLIDECGNPVDCGNCSNGSICLSNSCACTAVSDPCGDKVCGSAPNGCGTTVACGASNGLCSVGVCGPTGQCACPPSAAVCMGQTGMVVQNGCSYACSPGGCVADNAAACAGAACGTARNNCGDTVNCGAAAGACGAGATCIGSTFVLGSLLPAQTGSYAGGYCVADGIAKLLGKYAVRVHAFREAGTTSINFVNRAESISLVSIQYSRGTGQALLTDLGCAATTIGDPAQLSGGGTKTIVPKYRNLPPVTIALSINGAQFQRGDATNPVLGTGAPAGYTPGIPSFCAGLGGQDVALPAGDPRIGKWWPDNRCTCPTAAAPLPAKPGAADPNNYSTAICATAASSTTTSMASPASRPRPRRWASSTPSCTTRTSRTASGTA